ncbi:MAG: MoaD/ThiS family protein [Desulfocucumaceae bacterium]
MEEKEKKTVEVRGFSFIKELFDKRGFTFPFFVDLLEECEASELATRLEIPLDLVEGVFINGIASGIGAKIRPGDRVAFVPPGTPGPYRVILGLYRSGDKK